MSTLNRVRVVAVCATVLLLVQSCRHGFRDHEPGPPSARQPSQLTYLTYGLPAPDERCAVTANEFQNGWLTLTLPPPIGPLKSLKPIGTNSNLPYVFPANGPDFPGHAGAPTNCDFYKWGAQMFLWLTSSVNDKELAAGAPAPKPAPSPETDYVFSSEFFYAFDPSTGNLLNQNTPAINKVRTPKPVQATSTGQAGGHAVLLSQPRNAVSKRPSLVYYNVHTNRLLGYYRAQNPTTAAFASNLAFPSNKSDTCKLIEYGLANHYTKNSTWSNYLNGILCPVPPSTPPSTAPTIPDLETAIDFFSMIMEVKSSWVEADTLQFPEQYLLQKGIVPVFDEAVDTRGNATWVNTGKTRETTLALVGMHIAGTVKGHEEMVWVTIEHRANAPMRPFQYLAADGTVHTVRQLSEHRSLNWLFSDGTAASLETIGQEKGNSKAPAVTADGNIFSSSGPLRSVNVNILYPLGNAPGESKAQSLEDIGNNTELGSLDRSLFQILSDIRDPRRFYFVAGATWTSNGVPPTLATAPNVRGSRLLSNSTMETFQQQNGCFGCHLISQGSAPVNVSHIFGDINPTIPKWTEKD